ncbi:hypothetical protein D3C83_262450 [compost metagenome]
MEQERLNLEKQVMGAVGEVGKATSKEKRATAKMDKERKSKTLGNRKKWIPMR